MLSSELTPNALAQAGPGSFICFASKSRFLQALPDEAVAFLRRIIFVKSVRGKPPWGCNVFGTRSQTQAWEQGPKFVLEMRAPLLDDKPEQDAV